MDTAPFPALVSFRKEHAKRLIFSHLNVNSIRNKFCELHSILAGNYVDVFGLIETKLDESFPNAQFMVDGFSLYRADRNIHGGGIMCYVKSDIPHRLRTDISCNGNGIEMITIQLKFKDESVFISIMYRPPTVHISHLITALEYVSEKCLHEGTSLYIIGDLNVNVLKHPNLLDDVLDILSLTNVVREPTCFKNVDNPTLIDLILTNTPRRLTTVLNVPLGISDFHNFICVATRMCKPTKAIRQITYRSYKRFNETAYLHDLNCAPLHVSQIFTDVDDQYWFFNTLLKQIMDQHAPIKHKTVKTKQLPYMNNTLRKAINVKGHLRRKHNAMKTNSTWNKYRAQRNLVTKLKRESLKQYFDKECNLQSKTNRTFWNVVKPLVSNKGNLQSRDISLFEGNKIITDSTHICNIFNEHFVNVAQDLCESDEIRHMSIR